VIIIDFVDVISIVLGMRGRMIEFLAWYFRPQVNSSVICILLDRTVLNNLREIVHIENEQEWP